MGVGLFWWYGQPARRDPCAHSHTPPLSLSSSPLPIFCLAQLAAALRAAHAAGLAVRPPALSPTKVLLLPLGRVRIGALGLVEALSGDVALAGDDLLRAQRADVTVRFATAADC